MRHASIVGGPKMRLEPRSPLVIIATLCLAAAAHSAELLTLSPENYDSCAPKGKEARAFFGDYLLRNDKIVVTVAEA